MKDTGLLLTGDPARAATTRRAEYLMEDGI